MFLLRKFFSAAKRMLESLSEQFEPESPADRELREARASLVGERVRRSRK